MAEGKFTGFDAPWESAMRMTGPTFASNPYGNPDDLRFNSGATASNALPPFPVSDATYSGSLDMSQSLSRPYASLNFLDGYSPSANQESNTCHDARGSSYRLRIKSTASDPSPPRYTPPRYTLSDEKRHSAPNIQSHVSAEYGHWNPPLQPLPHPSRYAYSPYHETPPPVRYPVALPHSANYGHHNSGYPPAGYSDMYPPILAENLKPSIQTPAYSFNRPYKCDKCGSSFSRNHDLKRHARIHLAVKPFPCGGCDKAFSRKDALKRHLLVKGCSKNKEVSVDESLHGTDRSKSLQEHSVLAGNLRCEQLPWSSSVSLQRESSEDGSHSPRSSGSACSSSKSTITAVFDHIKLQNITCSVPRYNSKHSKEGSIQFTEESLKEDPDAETGDGHGVPKTLIEGNWGNIRSPPSVPKHREEEGFVVRA